MALFDDPRFILSHIRHSFRTSDESRMYELAMVTDIMHQIQFEPSATQDMTTPSAIVGGALDLYSSNDPELIQIAHSCDIVRDNELVGAHRRRSNTAHRLEKLKKERRIQAKIKRITLRNPPQNQDPSEDPLSKAITHKDVSWNDDIKTKEVTSLLSHLLDTRPLPVNPFSKYAVYDLRGQTSAKNLQIFLPMLPENERDFPMSVACLGTTRVGELIGLICWQYTSEGRKPELKFDPAGMKSVTSYYCLRFAEESGEIDEDFPAVDIREPIGKYDFPSYQLRESLLNEKAKLVVTFHVKDGISKITLDNDLATLRDAVDELLKHRKGLQVNIGQNCTVEKKNEPGVHLSLDARLNTFDTSEFILVYGAPTSSKANKSRTDLAAPRTSELQMFSQESFQIHNVDMIQKIGKNTTVQLAISRDKIEITPFARKSVNKMLWQVKPASHSMNEIVACELMTVRSRGDQRCFKIVYKNGESFRDYMFETTPQQAQEIATKVTCFLQMNQSEAQNVYKQERQRKLSRKQSFLTNPFS